MVGSQTAIESKKAQTPKLVVAKVGLKPARTLRIKVDSRISPSPIFAVSVSGSPMTIDKSLKVRSGMIRNRNVLTRAERITKLLEADRWKEGDPVLGIPKTRVVKVSLKKKKKVKKEEAAKANAEKTHIGFGAQIRSYVLHPYQMVKDLRTNVENNNPSAVLDGEIDPFIEAGIRWRMASTDA